MYYELYVDSLFLVNFVMNLYLLMLMNRGEPRTATRGRLVWAAAAGGLAYLLPFLLRGPVWIKWAAALWTGACLMVGIAFRPRNARLFLRRLGQLCWLSFLMGGLLLAAGSVLPGDLTKSVPGVLGLGTAGYLAAALVCDADRRRRRSATCRAVLARNGARVAVTALLDSGNSLREPVSGRPVAVIDDEIYRKLWGEERPLYRAVPYRSVGRPRGILKGYLLPELELEIDGASRRFRDVYVAVCEGETGMGMILNPALLEESGERGGPGPRRTKNKENRNGELR